MRIEALRSERIKEFIDYCKSHRIEVDDSFLYDDDLKNFKPDDENPTYILLNDKNEISGVVSLIIDDYHKRGNRGRFRIFHSTIVNREAYEMLFKAISNHTDDIKNLNLFINEENTKVTAIVENLGFKIERYAHHLIRDDIEITEASFPQGYELRTFQFGKDEEVWCEVRNAGFANLAGSKTARTPQWVSKMKDDENLLEGGMKLLYHNEEAVGQVAISKELDNGIMYTFIFSLCLKPEYQGMGLGRNLLRSALIYGRNKGMPNGMLTVNAENDNAVSLYLQEGFKKAETMVCYNYQKGGIK